MRWIPMAGLMLFLSQTAVATVLHVPADYPTIGSATSVAGPGDEVLVAAGTYHERFALLGPSQDGVRVHSESGPQVTIIDGGFTGPVVSMSGVGSGTELIGFTITRGGHSPAQGADIGGAIHLEQSSPKIDNDIMTQCVSFRGAVYVNQGTPSITSCVIDGNTSFQGGGIYIAAGNPAISGNTITNNQASNSGGGIFADLSTVPDIENNLIRGNQCQAGQGGGICVVAQSGGIVSGNQFVSNSGNIGGGMYVKGALNMSILDNVFQGNTATLGGGLVLARTRLLVENNKFINNSGGSAAGIYVDGPASPTILGNLIQNNDSSHGTGGGIYVYRGSGTIESNLFQTNTANIGGGLVLEGSSPVVENNQFLGNSGATAAGGIYVKSSTDPSNPNLLTNPDIRGNLVQDNDCAQGSGGGVYVDHGAYGMIEKNLILRNHCAAWGGGVTIWDHSRPTLTGNTIALNQGELGGGDVYVRGSSIVTLKGNILSHSPQQGLEQDDVDGLNTVTLSCNDVSNNAGGNYAGLPDPTGNNGNISSDPLFCDLMALDVHLSSASPCTAANAPAGCGLIGALDVNCEGPVPTQVTTWGGMKARYR